MIMRKTQVLTVAAATAIVLAASRAASAQEAADTQAMEIEEIVVTAQKRVESVQDVPLSVAAFTGATLRTRRSRACATCRGWCPIHREPRRADGERAHYDPRYRRRRQLGIDPSVGTFVDGVYVPRPGTLFTSFNDIAGVEVLRGPQGTLFGRNATVGAILRSPIRRTNSMPTSRWRAAITACRNTRRC